MPHNKSQAKNELQSKAPMKDEAITPSDKKVRERPASLNNISKNVTDDW